MTWLSSRYWAPLPLLTALLGYGVMAGCSAASSGSGEATGVGGGGAPNGSSSSSGGGDGGAGAGGPCEGDAEQCVGTNHQACVDGAWADAPCASGKGCDPASGACAECACVPGSARCASTSAVEVCEPSCLGYGASTSCAQGDKCVNGVCAPFTCLPGSHSCADDSTFTVCNDEGSGYDPGGACDAKEQCVEFEGCKSLCDVFAKSPSSAGCSFFALNMDNFNESNPDAVVVGNVSATLTAVVSLHGSPNGVESTLQQNVQIPPLGQHTFMLPNAASDVIESISLLRKGGSFRVQSDLPVVAYLHSPLTAQATNDASCLLPEATLGKHYFVPSYVDALNGHPSYFNVIATTDGTQVTFKVPVNTQGGTGVPAVSAGQSTVVTMNRYDTLQVVAPGSDVTGTEIVATEPVAVLGAVECAQVPAGATYCDHVEEQALPVRNWGTEYVGAHAPYRSGSERFYWRILASENDTVVETIPQQTGFPKTIQKGEFFEFWTQQSFVFKGNKPFLAVQYVSGQNAFGAGTGDPAMMTAVPVEQFMSRYVILTPGGYSNNYVQIIRSKADDVTVDGVVVPAASYTSVGAYTVADHPVSAGAHVIASVSPFGIMGVGYTGVTSYAYPGGMALKDLTVK